MLSPNRPSLLITGATGFIGGSLVNYFDCNPWYRVVTTGRSVSKGQVFHKKGISYLPVDLSLDSLINDGLHTDVIIHAAGLAAPWGSWKSFYTQNVLATRNLLSFALKNNVRRFVYLSSSSVYTSMQHQFNLTEDQLPSRFLNHYAASKYLAELAVLEAGRKGLPVTILRPRAVIGAGDTTVLPRIIQAHLDKRLRRIGSDSIQTDITTITNLTEAIRLALLLPASSSMNILNITDGKPVHLWAMVDTLFQELNFNPVKNSLSWPAARAISRASEIFGRLVQREPALPRYVACLLGRSLTMNIDKARFVLGYNPIQTTHDGVMDFITKYKTQNQAVYGSRHN